MKIVQLHSWDLNTKQAREIQQKLSENINTRQSLNPAHIKIVSAADISFNKFDDTIYAAVILTDFPELERLWLYSMKTRTTFPYISGYLSFREAPPILEIFKKIDVKPDVLLCDGHGIAHPRGLGLASHLGLFLNLPTIGCAKSILVGDYQEPDLIKGHHSPVIFEDRIVGAALRTRTGVKPVYVSVGHKIRLEDALQIVLQCSPRYRIPDPLRAAHKEVNKLRTRS